MSDTSYPSISVVIPSFNQGQYIEQTLISIIGQQYPNLEIIVIDGGSTDNTVEILKKYSDQITYWHSQKDNGQADAINQGMNLSSSEVVCWLNSDDMYLPGTLLDIGKRFWGHTDENYLIYGAAVTINQTEANLSSAAYISAPFEPFKLTYYDFVVQPSTFWTRKLWQCTGDLNINYSYVLDWEWFIRASRITEFEYVPKFYSVYRFHDSHKTSNGGVERRKEIIEVVKKYSSAYWINLYLEVESRYNFFEKILRLLEKFNFPKRKRLLPLFSIKIMAIIKERQDFYNIFTMLSGLP